MRKVIQEQFMLPETEDVDLELKNYLQNLADDDILSGNTTYNDYVTGKTIVIEEKHLPDIDLTNKRLKAIHKAYQDDTLPDHLNTKKGI